MYHVMVMGLFQKKYLVYLVLATLVILGGALRFTRVNWDGFGAFHPDERNISWAVTRIRFFHQMDPKFFAYGGLPIYLYRALGEGVVRLTHDPVWLYDWGHIAVIGRYVSATLSTISIYLIFLVGTVYFNKITGLASAAFLAFAPWAIREAHFQTTETMLVFFLLILAYHSRVVFSTPTKKLVFRIGIIWGLAMAAKTTALLFGLLPLAALWIPVLNTKLSARNAWHILGPKILLTILLVTSAGVLFFCFSPYTILDFRHFNESMTYESGVALGRFTVPYTLQFLNTTPYLYQLTTMLWQGGAEVVAGLAGVIVLIITAIQKKHKEIFVLLAFPLIYFGWTGLWFAKFSRYNVPFLPFLTITAAWLCVTLTKRFRRTGLAVTFIVLGATILWGLANWTVYLRPQTKVEATRWIKDNIPSDAVIYTEHWNDGLPLDLPDIPIYQRKLLTVYEQPDDDTKRIYFADTLSVGDYILLSTRRIWATMPRLEEKYPVTSVFYTKLLRGELGYTEVATFTSYPQLFGVQINDDQAEESVQVFDHPTVRIFKNSGRFTKNALFSILGGR